MKCEVCRENEVSEEPTKIVLDNGEHIMICEECAVLLGVIEQKVQEMTYDNAL